MVRLLRMLLAPLLRSLGRLRSPWLFAIALAIFVVDLIVPDLLPLVDEIVMGIVTLILARRKRL